MSEEENELRRMLAARAESVHSHLSGPAIRARAHSRGAVRRYAPLISAAAVLAIVVVLGLVLLQRGGSPATTVPPAVSVTTTVPPTAVTSPAPVYVTTPPTAARPISVTAGATPSH